METFSSNFKLLPDYVRNQKTKKLVKFGYKYIENLEDIFGLRTKDYVGLRRSQLSSKRLYLFG